MTCYWQHQSRWVSSTARTGLPAPPLSGWFFSAGSSTPSNLTAHAPQWNLARRGRTKIWERGEEFRGISASLDACSARQGNGNVIKVKAYVFFILQLNTPYPTELSPLRERLVIGFLEDAGSAPNKIRIMKWSPGNHTCFPRGESSESPPMRPSMLWLLSPCRHK